MSDINMDASEWAREAAEARSLADHRCEECGKFVINGKCGCVEETSDYHDLGGES